MPNDSAHHAKQNHWSECGRATSVANTGALGRPHRSVLTLGIHYIKNNMKALFTLVIGFGLVCASFGGSTDQATSPELLFSRTYKVSADTFVAHLKHLLPPKSGETDTELLVRFFKQKDVEVKPPESIFLNEQMGMLFARATKSDQDKIEKLVEKIVLGRDVPVS